MTRYLLSIITITTLACEDNSQQPTNTVHVDEQWTPEFEQVPGTEEEQGRKASLVCASSSFYQGDSSEVLRMQLFQGTEGLTVEASKGTAHPDSHSQFRNAVFEVAGTVGDEFLSLTLDSSNEVLDEEEAFEGIISMDLIRYELGDQVFYKGGFNQHGCGTYSGEDINGVWFSNSVTCWQPDIEPQFSYNPREGVCLNERNEVGFNPWTLEMIRETHDGQCAQLGFTQLNEMDYDLPELSWDLRGSDLNQSFIFSANLSNARLEGAQLENLYFSEAEIDGSMDDFTLFPEICEERGARLYCKN